MRLALGATQFGMKYGLFNKKKINKKDYKKIEKLTLDSSINFIDTATAYGNSEKIIGNSSLKKLKIITKINISTTNKNNIKNSINKTVLKLLNSLNTKKIYGLLVHNSKDLLGEKGKIFLSCLQELKKKKIVKKIGISIYSPKELDLIWKFWKPDLVQAPFNLFDQRILNSGWVDILKKNKIKIFARSCFLQGLLIGDYGSLKISKKLLFQLKKFDDWCELNKISRLKACLDFIKQFKKIDCIIVGFNNVKQLDEILVNFKKKTQKIPKKFVVNNLNFIDPRRWK
jgi:aryl-alcohol dehydrogenase-like predicted oxidoreductase